jgi:CheY-like chemotaxis protein
VPTLLVVDDDPTILSLVSDILRDEGYEVLSAGGGQAALDVFEQGAAVDLVVLDMRMPVVDGWAVSHELKRRGVDVPIVVMTAARDAAQSARQIGAAAYLAKPFDVDDLVSRVQATLDALPPA